MGRNVISRDLEGTDIRKKAGKSFPGDTSEGQRGNS